MRVIILKLNLKDRMGVELVGILSNGSDTRGTKEKLRERH